MPLPYEKANKKAYCTFPGCGCPIDKTTICAKGLPDPEPASRDTQVALLSGEESSVIFLARMLISANANREPDLIIGGPDNPYLRRWWLQKDPARSSVYLHQMLRDDDDRALHDHPWPNTSIILDGTIREVTPGGSRMLTPGSITHRKATDSHRLEIVDGPAWSLFITGKRCREWGFHCPQGWRHWREFVDTRDHGQIGRGCD